jgi:DUF1009 family protein
MVMDDQKKSLMKEIIDVLEPAGFEVIGFEGPKYQVVCDWATITVMRFSPDDLKNAQRGSILRA